MCFLMLAVLSGACMPLSYVDNEYVFISCVWLVMFCNGFIEPIFTGILLNSVSSEEAATASSVLIFMQMILGFLPAPYVYGLLVDEFPTFDAEGDNTSPWGMRGVSFYSVLGVLALLVSIMVRKRSPQSEMARSVVSIQSPNEEQLLA